MHIQVAALLLTTTLITGCSSVGSVSQNQTASKIVSQVHPNHVKHPDMESLNASFNEDSTSSTFSGSVVELSGEIISFASTEDGLYTVTISDGETNVLCVFDDDIADKLGTDRAVHNGATITVQGQCHASGLFSASAFTLDGCKIVSN